MLVFVQHAPASSAFGNAYYLGATGVGFFFVLSGFILTYTYQHDFAMSLDRVALRRFYVARVARLYPVHLVTMAFMVAFLVRYGGGFWSEATEPVRLAAVLAQLVLLQSWIPLRDVYFGANGPAWSISVEAFFYTLFPLLVHGCLRALRTASWRSVIALAGALWTLALALESTPRWSPLATQWFFSVYPPMRLPDFLIGMLLGIAFLRHDSAARSRADGTRAEIYVLVALTLAVLVSPVFPDSVRAATLPLPFSGAVIYVFARARGRIARVLGRPAFVRLGEISFSFYLAHSLAIAIVSRIPLPGLLATALSLALALAASFGLFRYVETPMRAVIRHAFSTAGAVDDRASPASAARTLS